MDTRIDPAKVARFLGAWRSQTLPDYRALAHGLTSLIDGSLLPAAHVLPSQRRLAAALGVARGTVVRAYGILHESGRLEPRRGSGNYVARPRAVGSDIDGRLLSFADRSPAVDLSSGALPGDELVAEAIGAVGPMLSGDRLASPGYSPSGLPELRSLIAERHTDAGLATSPEQILVTAGAQQAVWLIANALAGPGTLTLLEDPTYRGALEAFAGAGGEQLLKRNQRRLQMQADFVFYAGGLPVAAGVFGKADIDVAAINLCVFGQRQRNGGAAVAGKHADFQITAHAREFGQPGQQCGLLGGNRHFAQTVRFGLAADGGQNVGLGRAHLPQVLAQFGRELCRLNRHVQAAFGLIGLVGIRFFGHGGGFEGFLLFGIQLHIPQQGAVFQTALGFFGVLLQIIVQEFCGVGLVFVVHGALLAVQR